MTREVEIEPYDYIVEWSGRAKPDDIVLNHVPSTLQLTDITQAQVLSSALRIRQRRGQRDGMILRYEGLSVDDNRLCLNVSKTSYAALLGTNIDNNSAVSASGRTYWDMGRRNELADAITVSTLLVSTDGQLMLGYRSGVGVGRNQLGVFGGMANTDEAVQFASEGQESGHGVFRLVDQELSDELGLGDDEVKSELIAVARDQKFRKPTFMFITHSTLSADEIVARFEAIKAQHTEGSAEHANIKGVPFTYGGVVGVLSSGESLTEATKVGLRVALNNLL